MFKKITFSVLFICCSVATFSQINYWKTAIYASNQWRFLPGFTNPGTDWTDLNFDDGTWSIGNGGIGYDDGDDNTVIAPIASLFMRRKFEVTDLSIVEAAVLHADYDDAFIAYLNGIEIARANITGNPPAYDADATDWREAQVYQGGSHEAYFMDNTQVQQLLIEGENVLAIQVHNKEGANSSDMSAIFFLSLGLSSDSDDYGPTPSWFEEPGFTTHLPIITINTNGQQILDEEDIIADLGIIWKGDGNLNHPLDEPTEYQGQVGIELRGSSSLWFPKNNFEFETKDEFGEDVDTSFLGFPAEEDWILHGPFSDKTLMRNVMTMHLARQMGQYASKTRYVELVINGNYMGLYVLMEKIKRAEGRVDIAKLKESDIDGDEVTGGYIFKVDRGDPAWYSQYNMWKNGWQKLPYVLVYPKLDNIQPEQLDYIQSYVDSFEMAVWSSSYYFAGKRYDEFIDMQSFADHFLLSELGKNVDAYRLSSYLHKKKDSNGGKIYAGPIWDFNLAFNNADYGDAWTTDGWMYYISLAAAEPAWWDRMLNDEKFQNLLKCRWEELRQGPLHIDSIYNFIDEQVDLMDDAVTRNFEKWNILDEYVWPNPVVTGSYAGEIGTMKSWIANRIIWMDANMFGECEAVSTNEFEKEAYFTVFPNPTNGILNIQSIDNQPINNSKIYLTDVFGRELTVLPSNTKTLDLSDYSNGIYFIVMEIDGRKSWRKVVKN